MLKIQPMRAALGKNVTAKLRNEKDDKQRVIEFSITELSITLAQLDDLVACGKSERAFSAVAFSSADAISELRHFKKIEHVIEVQNATICLQRIGEHANSITVETCTIKKIGLSFAGSGADRCVMSCVVQTPLDTEKLTTIGAWGSEDLFVSIESPGHGDEPD